MGDSIREWPLGKYQNTVIKERRKDSPFVLPPLPSLQVTSLVPVTPFFSSVILTFRGKDAAITVEFH